MGQRANPAVYFMVKRRDQTTPVGTFLYYIDAMKVAERQMEYDTCIGYVEPTLVMNEGYKSVDAYNDVVQERIDARNRQTLSDSNIQRVGYGWPIENWEEYCKRNKIPLIKR